MTADPNPDNATEFGRGLRELFEVLDRREQPDYSQTHDYFYEGDDE